MSLDKQLKKFLEKEFKKRNLTIKQFSEESEIAESNIFGFLNAKYPNPEFYTILKIANCCNCSLNKVMGIKELPMLKKHNFILLSKKEVNLSTKEFIEKKIQKFNLNKYDLARDLGFNAHIISDFIKNSNRQKTLGAALILALIKRFKILSIDVVIKRVSLSSQELQLLEELEEKYKY